MRVDHAVVEVDPDGAAQRHAERHEQRVFEVLPDADGMATIRLFLKAETAQELRRWFMLPCVYGFFT